MSESKVYYDYYSIDEGYDYEPIALLQNGEIKRIGDNSHNPHMDREIEAIIETAKEYAGDRIVVNHLQVTKENLHEIKNERVRKEFSYFLDDM